MVYSYQSFLTEDIKSIFLINCGAVSCYLPTYLPTYLSYLPSYLPLSTYLSFHQSYDLIAISTDITRIASVVIPSILFTSLTLFTINIYILSPLTTPTVSYCSHCCIHLFLISSLPYLISYLPPLPTTAFQHP